MTIVSLTHCCHLLAVDPKTLRRWMSLSGLSAQPHPSDTRQKCITREQVQRLASAHRRTLPDHVQPEISVPATSTSLSAPVLSNLLPDFSPHIADLTMQLVSLQAHVATLQHQLTLLTDQLQKEQEWRISEASATEEKSLGPSKEKSQEKSQRPSKEKSLEKSQESPQEKSRKFSREKSLEPSQKKSQASSREKSQEKESACMVANASARADQRKIPHVLPLVEYGA